MPPALIAATLLLCLLLYAGYVLKEENSGYWIGLAGYGLAILGVFGNYFVVRANGYRMPIISQNPADLVETSLYTPANDTTRYRFLVDRFDIGIGMASAGDILAAIGLVVFVLGYLFRVF